MKVFCQLNNCPYEGFAVGQVTGEFPCGFLDGAAIADEGGFVKGLEHGSGGRWWEGRDGFCGGGFGLGLLEDPLDAEVAADSVEQLALVEGLWNVGVEEPVFRAEEVFFSNACGERKDGNGLEVGVFFEDGDGVKAAHVRHAQVHQDEVRVDLAGEVAAFPA